MKWGGKAARDWRAADAGTANSNSLGCSGQQREVFTEKKCGMERMRVVREYESCDVLPTDVWRCAEWCGWNLVWLGRERLGDASLRRFMSS